MKVSQRAQQVPASATIAVTSRAQELKAQGVDVVGIDYAGNALPDEGPCPVVYLDVVRVGNLLHKDYDLHIFNSCMLTRRHRTTRAAI